MVDTYTTALRARKIEQGAYSDTHGTRLNEDVFDLFDHAISGTESINFGSSTSYALAALADGADSESRALRLNFSGTPASAVTVTVPASVTSKLYVVQNGSGQTLTIKYAATAGIAIANGNRQVVFADGTDVWPVTLAVNSSGSLPNLTVTGALTLNGALTTDNTTADEIGFKGLPQNAQAGNYTLALSDAGKFIAANGSAATITVPPNASVAFPVGTTVSVLNQNGTNNISIAQGAGVTIVLLGTSTTGTRTLTGAASTYSLAELFKVDTNTWVISGTGLS